MNLTAELIKIYKVIIMAAVMINNLKKDIKVASKYYVICLHWLKFVQQWQIRGGYLIE